jgi:amylosucrase
VIDTGNPHLFGFVRSHAGERLALLANFTEAQQTLEAYRLRQHGFTRPGTDQLTGEIYRPEHELTLEPYQLLCLSA